MQFNKYYRKENSFEKQMQIAENEKKLEMTLDRINIHLPNAIIHNTETDSLCRHIASVADLSNTSPYFVNPQRGPQTKEQKEMMDEIRYIEYCVQEGIKMNFLVDMINKKYLSACKPEDIGTCLCCLYPVNASKPIMLLAEEDQKLDFCTYVGTPNQEGVAYLFVEDKVGSLFIQLQEFHFLSLRKDPVHNFHHGLFLSCNPEWGWKNISFSIILKENQDMVWQLFDSVKRSIIPRNQTNNNGMNVWDTPEDKSYGYSGFKPVDQRF